MKKWSRNNKGFTLIELLVVISIISLLSSVVLSSLNGARAKARDAKAKSELAQVQIALNFYFDKFGTMPTPADISPETLAFNEIASTLVTQGFLGAVPVAPANHTYMYYRYSPGSEAGGLLVTSLEAAAPTITPYPGTCRPFSGGGNWCDTGAPSAPSTYYCLCNPY